MERIRKFFKERENKEVLALKNQILVLEKEIAYWKNIALNFKKYHN